jgi:integrase
MDTYAKKLFCSIIDTVLVLQGNFNDLAKNMLRLQNYIGEREALIRDSFKIIDFKAVKGEDMLPKYADGSFRERPNGLLEYRFIHKEERLSVYGYSKPECWNKRTDIISGKVKKVSNKMKYSEWLLHFYKVYKEPHNSPGWNKNLKRYIDNDITPILGRYYLDDLTGDIITEFLNRYAEKGNTLNKIADVIKSSLKSAVANNKMKRDPFGAVFFMKHKSTHFEVYDFEMQQFIYDKIDDIRYKRLFVFLMCTGVRIDEAFKIKKENIDFKLNLITIIKNNKHKNKGVTRQVPFLPKLIDWEIENFLFDGLTYAGFQNYLQDLYDKLKIKKKGRFIHSCRHTFISVCYYIGIKDKQIQEWVGHSTVEMTLNTYTHLLKNGTSFVLEYLKELKETLKI